MLRFILIVLLGCNAAGCATTETRHAAAVPLIDAPQTAIEVRATTQKSANLFEIEDPLVQAVEARVKGHYDVAYQKFYAAWLATPRSEAVIIGLADMALKTGHTEQAYSAISELKLDTETVNPALLASQVLTEIAVGKSPDIELRLNQALKRAPKDARLWNAMGRFYDSESLWLQAQDCYIRSHKFGGSKAGLNNNLGMSLLMQGRLSAALSKFEHAFDIEKDVDLYDNNRRLTLAVMGQFDKATNGMSPMRAADILNDAGYIAKLTQQNARAKALFKAAIEHSETYHAKAHENLTNLKLK